MQLNALDLNLLVALDALLAEQSITRAAQRLNLSPSATSGALGRLRDYFGDELLARVGRRMVPTPLGEILRGEVRDCLLHIQAAVQARPSFDPAQARRHFRLMMSDYAATVVMPGVLQRLEREAPGLTLELLSTSTQPWDALDRGDIDFLVLPRQFIRDPHPCVALFADDYVCVVSADHPTVGSELTVAQFLALGHVVTRVGTYRPPTVDETYFERFGQVRRIEVIARSPIRRAYASRRRESAAAPGSVFVGICRVLQAVSVARGIDLGTMRAHPGDQLPCLILEAAPQRGQFVTHFRRHLIAGLPPHHAIALQCAQLQGHDALRYLAFRGQPAQNPA